MELKALKMLKKSKSFREHAIIAINPSDFSKPIMERELDQLEEAIRELERLKDILWEKDKIIEAQQLKLEALENQDKLAELEKVILDCYLVQGYQIGVGGWAFKVNISTLHKTKEIQIMFRENIYSNLETIFRTDAKTTKEMFDKAIDFFNLWSSDAFMSRITK